MVFQKNWGKHILFKVYFENRFEKRFFIDTATNEAEICKLIKRDLSIRARSEFKWYYTRSWTRENGEIVYDVGSWCEYYIAVPIC